MSTVSFMGTASVMAQFQSNPDPLRIAMLGCVKQTEPIPAFESYAKLDADISLWMGDNVYADTEDDPSFIRQSYQTLASKPFFDDIIGRTTVMATWDDHDFGLNDAGKNYPLKEESKQIFRSFWGLEDDIPADQDGVYHSKFVAHQGHNIQFIFLDPRYNRDEPSLDRSGDTLGELQWAWFEEELNKEADLRFIVSGYQVLLNHGTGSETWATFPEARERMFDLIKTTGAEHVIFLTGDQHYAEVSRIRGALDYDAIELQFASVNQIETPEKNIHRVSTVASSKHSFAWIDLHLDETEYDQPYVSFTVKSHESGETEVFYRVNLSEIDRDFALTGNERFVDQTTISLSTEFDHLIPRVAFTPGADASKIDDLAGPTSQSMSLKERSTFNESGIVKVALFDAEGNRRSQVQSMQLTKLRPINSLNMSREELKQGVNFRYVEGEFDDIPDFDQAQILDTGIALDWDVEAMAGQEDHYAFEFTGYLHVQEEGVYTFSTRSDDGSRLYIHDDLVVENGGSHSIRVRTGQIALKPGL
ncbi:MAG: PA14 domain-containing protein, partial [Balneolaceae bacterium]|nr:PA14 domain-containing protein [Balneolaceae bacterium]